MGNANEWELAVLPVDRWDTLPDFGIGPEIGPTVKELNSSVDWGGSWQVANCWNWSSLLLIVVTDELKWLVMLPSSISLFEYVLLVWLLLSIASVANDTIEFANNASLFGVYKLSKVKIFIYLFCVCVCVCEKELQRLINYNELGKSWPLFPTHN